MAIIEISTGPCRPERLLLSGKSLSLLCWMVALRGRRFVQDALILLGDWRDSYIVDLSWLHKGSFDRRFEVSVEKASEVGPVKDVLSFSWLGMFGLLELEGALRAVVMLWLHHVAHFECVLERRVRVVVFLTDHVCVHARPELQRFVANRLFFLPQEPWRI